MDKIALINSNVNRKINLEKYFEKQFISIPINDFTDIPHVIKNQSPDCFIIYPSDAPAIVADAVEHLKSAGLADCYPVFILSDSSDIDLSEKYLKSGVDNILLPGANPTGIICREIENAISRYKLINKLKINQERTDYITERSSTVIYAAEKRPGEIPVCTYISNNVKDFLGYSPDDIIGKPDLWIKGVHPDDLEEMEQNRFLLEEKGFASFEYRYRDTEGNYKWLHDDQRITGSVDGKVKIYGSWYDISAQKEAEFELKAERERLDAIMNSVKAGIILIDTENLTILEANPAAAEIFEMTVEELRGNRCHALIDKRDNPLCPIIDYGLKIDNSERRIFTKSGEVRQVLKTAVPLEMHGKKYILESIVDLSERKKAEERLSESDKLLRNLSKQLPGVIYTYQYYPDGRSRFPFASEQIQNIYEVSPDEVKKDASTVFNRIHPDDYDGVVESIRHSFNTLKTWNHEYRVDLPVRGIRWLHGLAVPEKQDDGSVLWYGFISDSTERKQIELELEKSQKRFQLAVEGSNDGLWDWDIAGDELFLAKRWKEQLGYKEDEIESSFDSFISLVYHEDIERINKEVELYFSGAIPKYEIEFRMKHKDGSLRWILARGAALRDESGKIYRMAGSHSDITARKNVERRLREAKEQAETANKAKSDFLANMSHEIRTPLNGVIGFSKLLLKTKLSNLQRQYAENASNSAGALLGVINDILDFSKIEAGKLELEVVKSDICEIIESSIDIIRYPAAVKKIEVLLNITPDVPKFALLDPVRLKQVLTNLLGNAVKFTESGEIELKVEYTERNRGRGRYHFSVSDTGIGISRSHRLKLFKAFSQADSSTTRKFGGTGLGLIISDSIIEKMGGKIGLESEPGKGSTFYFNIETEVFPEEREEPQEIEGIKSCLIVDDNLKSINLTADILKRLNIEFETAHTGIDALNILGTGKRFDVILIDYDMPVLDGLETVKIIRKKGDLVPEDQAFILLSSAFDDEEMLAKCEQLNIRMRIGKPVKQNKLRRCLAGINSDTVQEIEEDEVNKVLSEDSQIKILLVEDNLVNMVLARSLIKSFLPNARISEAKNGKAAIDEIRKNEPDLVFMDVQMPIMDGNTATKKIRDMEKKNELQGHVPIIGLTAGALKEEKEKCISSGMDEFLTKPVRPEKLREILSLYIFEDIRELLSTPASDIPNRTDKGNRKHFDKEELFERMSRNQEIYDELLAASPPDITERVSLLEKAIDDKNTNEVRELAHSLKGTAMNMCMPVMQELCRKLESDISDESVSTDILHAAYEEIKAEWEIIQKML